MLEVLKTKRDFLAGGLMILIGLGTVLEASTYNPGTLRHMGPGFFPIMLGVVLVFVGILIALGATAAQGAGDDHAPAIKKAEWRGWLCIIAGPILFIVLGQYGGLIPATFACVFVSAMGDRSATFKNSAMLAAGIAVMGALLFSYVLHVPFPLFRWV